MTDRKGRLTPKVRTAIEEIVFRGRNREEAATIAGIQPDSLYRALRRPEVLSYRTLLMEVLRSGASARTLSKIENLMDTATSEHVRLQAAQWLAGIDGISPLARQEIEHRHVGTAPGLTINLITGPAPAPMIDITPVAPAITMHNGRPMPVPTLHPSQRKAQS
jgi:hypothetical protein